MCGIAGLLGNGGLEDAISMASAIGHRGPDGSGDFQASVEQTNGSVAFSHARLSIIDLDGSQQPIHSDHGCVLMVNGEIYNHKEIKSEKKIFINSLEKLIQTCVDKKEIKLKYELEKNVNLVKFEKNIIEISFNENLDKNFVKDLSSKLFDWTGERWIISFSQLKGDVSMREKKQKIKRSLMDEAKNSKIYKDVIKNFPDAELTDINFKGEDEPND